MGGGFLQVHLSKFTFFKNDFYIVSINHEILSPNSYY